MFLLGENFRHGEFLCRDCCQSRLTTACISISLSTKKSHLVAHGLSCRSLSLHPMSHRHPDTACPASPRDGHIEEPRSSGTPRTCRRPFIVSSSEPGHRAPDKAWSPLPPPSLSSPSSSPVQLIRTGLCLCIHILQLRSWDTITYLLSRWFAVVCCRCCGWNGRDALCVVLRIASPRPPLPSRGSSEATT